MSAKRAVLLIVILFTLIIVQLIFTAPDVPAGNYLIYARSADSSTLDPQEMQWGEDVKVAENIYENLVRFTDEPPNVQGHLAERWETSKDGLTWTFHLRKDVMFTDGTPFNADAVVFAIHRLTDAKHPHRPEKQPYAPFYTEFIESVEAAKPHTVMFTLKKPSAVFLQLLAIFPAAIPSPAAVQKYGKNFPRRPVGSGPFSFREWKTAEKIVLVRNPTYWSAAPKIARLIFVPAQNPQTAMERLKKNEIHMMDHPTLAEVKRLREDPDLQVKSVASPNVAYLAFNMSGQAPPYDNLHFRRAVALALDRTFLNRQVYFGLAVPAKNLVPPTLWADIGELDDYEHNLEKAKEELAKADLPDDFVAEVWHMNFARDYMPEPNKVAEFVKDQLARIGLKVRIQTFDKAAYSAKVKDKRHPMCLLGWMADYPDPDNFLKLLHGDFKNDLNISFFDDPEFNRLITDAASISDWEKRKSLYLQAAKIYRDQVPSLALVHTQRVFAMRKDVKFRPHPIDYRIYRAHLSK